ncbi:MAG: hypothetical protein KDA53_17465 [Hyphomonas sp.]|nr:hypothetical protein [Hyphomonas sp.]
MTEPPAARRKRHRRPDPECAATRLLAREAAEAGERLSSIRRRLRIPRSTLADWAKADGFRATDLATRRAEAELAAAREAGRADHIREQAETAWREATAAADAPAPSGMAERVGLARARAALLLEEGLVEAAEAELAGVRRILRLLNFAAPVAKLMDGYLLTDEDIYSSTAAIAWVWAQPHDVRLSVGKDPYWWTVNARAGFDRLTPEEKRPWIDIAREGDRQIREDNARLQAEREGEGP